MDTIGVLSIPGQLLDGHHAMEMREGADGMEM